MAARRDWAIALHGGAGAMPEERLAGSETEIRGSLRAALELGAGMLRGGASSLDTVEAVVRLLEDDPCFNAGRGAVYHRDGGHELDASIMEGRTLRCGAVTCVTTVRNPVTLARRVMERTPHVMLAGAGAETFAREVGVEIVDPSYFDTARRRQDLDRALREEVAGGPAAPDFGTVGAVARDRSGSLAAATSTGGRTAKRRGRIGDSPVIGAGTYADDRSCAVSATGKGEELMRHVAAASISLRVEVGGRTLEQAVRELVRDVLAPGVGGVIAVDPGGALVLDFTTEGMFRGAADSDGRFEVGLR